MKSQCCGEYLTRQSPEGSIIHFWKCYVCGKRYSQKTRLSKAYKQAVQAREEAAKDGK